MDHPTTRSGATITIGSRLAQPQPRPQVPRDFSLESESEDEHLIQVAGPRMATPRETPETGDSHAQPTEQSSVTAKKRNRPTKSAGPVPSINWMRGQKQYSLQDALNELTPKISFPQLLDVSPRLRCELVELLRFSVPRVRKKGKAVASTSAAGQSTSMPVGLVKKTSLILTEAQGDDEVTCLYIDAFIGRHLIKDVRVDSGAMLDLISLSVANELKLEIHIVKGLGMRKGDDSLVRLDYYVWADVIVAGIVARIKAYIRKNAKSCLAASGAQGAKDVTVQTWPTLAFVNSPGV